MSLFDPGVTDGLGNLLSQGYNTVVLGFERGSITLPPMLSCLELG